MLFYNQIKKASLFVAFRFKKYEIILKLYVQHLKLFSIFKEIKGPAQHFKRYLCVQIDNQKVFCSPGLRTKYF